MDERTVPCFACGATVGSARCPCPCGPRKQPFDEGFEAGLFFAACRDVQRAIPSLEKDAASATKWTALCLRELLDRARMCPRSKVDDQHALGFYVGVWHLGERKRRRAVGLLAASRRWLAGP